MVDFTIRTSDQVPTVLQAFRKEAGLTQAEAALRLGVTQQTMSALERNAEKVSVERLMRLLSILGVELVLRQSSPDDAAKPSDAASCGPTW